LMRAFSTIQEDIDYFYVDTASGISDMVLSFCRAAQDVLMVVCNEPTSVADAYAQMKVLSRDYGVKKFKIIGNQLHSLDEGKLMYQKLVTVTERFIDATLELVACIPVDMNMRKAIRQRSCVVEVLRISSAGRAFRTLANRITSWPITEVAGGHLEFFVENLIKNNK
uniref:MinD/ParA family ATP-binding protein n=1 Tax=Succinivibrio sp. TaxID=2053619 RepID=UPI003FEFAE5B